MKHIGILAHSADGAGLCYGEMIRESARRMGAHFHPEITLTILPMGETLDAWAKMDLADVMRTLSHSAARLEAAGCDFFVCPDNTAHIALETPGVSLPLPGLHIAEIVVREAKAQGRGKIGLLGTQWTMEGPVYLDACARHGLKLQVPAAEDRIAIDRIIFDELCQGVIAAESRAEFVRVIEGLKAAGADCAALSCTEIPLIVTPEVSPLPVLDSTRLLARAAVAAAMEDAPAPTWRGGPL